MEIKNRNKKTLKNINLTLKYFEKDCLEFNKIIQEIEIQKQQLKFNLGFIYSLKIVVNIENPKNNFLKDTYYILFSKSGKIKTISKSNFYNYRESKILKKILNRSWLK